MWIPSFPCNKTGSWHFTPMKILDHKAAHLLFEQVKCMNEAPHDLWRCIYLNFANKNLHCKAEIYDHFVVDYLKESMAASEGEIFLCEDGDIFILFEGALKPVVKKLGEHFKGIMPEPLWMQPSDILYTIFDLSKYWELFFALCQAKRHQTTVKI